jgi:pyrroline-5-carboxylate reductase
MENQRISIIGGGNMPEPSSGNGGRRTPENITVCDIDAARGRIPGKIRRTRHRRERSGRPLRTRRADGRQPDVCGRVLAECGELMQGKALVSIVAGWSCASIAALLPDGVRILRVMPNTPALVGEGMSVFCTEHTLEADEYAFIESIFASFGRVMSLPERYFDAVTALSGSGPAYVFLFIEALADGGVKQGLPRGVAGMAPKRCLALPGWCWIAAGILGNSRTRVFAAWPHRGRITLEKSGFRGAVLDAEEQCGEENQNHCHRRASFGSTKYHIKNGWIV